MQVKGTPKDRFSHKDAHLVVLFLGLPNTFGDYDETPEMMAAQLKVDLIYLYTFDK